MNPVASPRPVPPLRGGVLQVVRVPKNRSWGLLRIRFSRSALRSPPFHGPQALERRSDRISATEGGTLLDLLLHTANHSPALTRKTPQPPGRSGKAVVECSQPEQGG